MSISTSTRSQTKKSNTASAPIETIRQLVSSFVICAAVFSLGNIVSNSIPVTSSMKENIANSALTLNAEGLYFQLMAGSPNWQNDNFTNALMLNIAAHNNNLGVVGAFGNYHYEPDETNYTANLLDSLDKTKPQATTDQDAGWISYARYWHGYLVFLKPLLLFLDINQIRTLVFLAITALIASNAALLARRTGPCTSFAFTIPFAMAAYPVASTSLSFSSSFVIALVANLLVLCTKRQFLYKNGAVFFFSIGAITSYFDFLCNPILTFGIPFATALFLQGLSNSNNFRSKRFAAAIIKMGISWSAGYITLWTTKWLLSSLILNQNVVADALEAIFRRTDASAGRLESISANIYVMFPFWIIVALALSAIVLTLACIYHRSRLTKSTLMLTLALLITSLIPYIWYLALANHSTIHCFFTWRNQIITLLCWFYAASLLYLTIRRDPEVSSRHSTGHSSPARPGLPRP